MQRAGILDRHGEPLTVTERRADGWRRSTPPAHLLFPVGFVDARFGRSGLEAVLDDNLLGRNGWLGSIEALLTGRPTDSQDLRTTLDRRLQQAAWDALGPRRGAVVILEPATGDLLALVSRPFAHPWAASAESTAHAPFFPRATLGQYPPGSVWKAGLLAVALDAGAVRPWETFIDQGVVRAGGRRIVNAGGVAYGVLNLVEALAVSSNTVFVEVGLRAGEGAVSQFLTGLGRVTGAAMELPVFAGALGPLHSAAAVAEAAIGQGNLLVSPLQMAVMAACIANGGLCRAPHLMLDNERRPAERGRSIRLFSEHSARLVARGLALAVTEGTAANTGLAELGVVGKTGTAEIAHGRPHAWFVGFAPAERPQWAVSVLVEQGGSGRAVAAPVAADVFRFAQRLGMGSTRETGDAP